MHFSKVSDTFSHSYFCNCCYDWITGLGYSLFLRKSVAELCIVLVELILWPAHAEPGTLELPGTNFLAKWKSLYALLATPQSEPMVWPQLKMHFWVFWVPSVTYFKFSSRHPRTKESGRENTATSCVRCSPLCKGTFCGEDGQGTPEKQ